MQSKIINLQGLLNHHWTTALPPLYATEAIPLEEKLVVCKFYIPDHPNGWSWYVFEGQRLTNYLDDDGYLIKNDYRLFGMVHGFEKEMGYFLLSELAQLRNPQTGQFWVQLDTQVFLQPYGQIAK